MDRVKVPLTPSPLTLSESPRFTHFAEPRDRPARTTRWLFDNRYSGCVARSPRRNEPNRSQRARRTNRVGGSKPGIFAQDAIAPVTKRTHCASADEREHFAIEAVVHAQIQRVGHDVLRAAVARAVRHVED